MSQSNESYRQFKLIKELRQKQEEGYINDYSDVDEFESCYCDLCDRQLVQYDTPDRLICPTCQIIIDTNFSIVRRKPTRQGPVDLEDDGSNDSSGLSEHYSFQNQRRQEKEDPFISSLKSAGYQIISSK